MQTHNTRHRVLIGAGAAFGAAALVFAGAGAASAHVSVQSDTAAAGSYAVLTFSVPHGCDGSATTGISIQIPEGINAVTPTRNSSYTVEKVAEALATPITDSHGNEITERIDEVIYTAVTPLPDGYRDAFELSVQLPEEAAGETLYFPVVQTCEQGETAWVEMPVDGQDAHELDAPAPSIAVAAAPDGSQGADDHGAAGADSADAVDAPSTQGAAQTPVIVAALAVGSLGLIAGIVALIRGRKQA